jgi:hypothetical protein
MGTVLILFLAVAAMMIGLGKGGLGSAFAGVVTPIASIFMPVSEVVAYLLPLLIVGDWIALRAYWGKWDKVQLKLMLPPAFITVLLGTYLLANLPTGTLRHILGIVTLIVGTYKLIEVRLRRLQYAYRPWHGVIAGGMAGLGSGLASAGGPALTAYLLLVRMNPLPYIATSAIFFAIMNLLRLPGLYAAGVFDQEKLIRIIWFLPLVWLGTWLGRDLIKRINPHHFERLMTTILIIAGMVLLVQ